MSKCWAGGEVAEALKPIIIPQDTGLTTVEFSTAAKVFRLLCQLADTDEYEEMLRLQGAIRALTGDVCKDIDEKVANYAESKNGSEGQG